MSFTNEDLKRLKDDVAKGGWSPKMPALLARLEASEALNAMVPKAYVGSLWKAWRASKGEE